jgi:predicted RNA-binding Zn-ribbon protein involved in translation (DUF1610 family)
MADREKYIEVLSKTAKTVKEFGEDTPIKISLQCVEDILELLKEQETEDTGSCRIFQCKKCGFGIDDIFVNDEEKYQIVPRYCPNCGRSVKGNE